MNIEVAEKIADEWLSSIYWTAIIALVIGFLFGYFFRKESED